MRSLPLLTVNLGVRGRISTWADGCVYLRLLEYPFFFILIFLRHLFPLALDQRAVASPRGIQFPIQFLVCLSLVRVCPVPRKKLEAVLNSTCRPLPNLASELLLQMITSLVSPPPPFLALLTPRPILFSAWQPNSSNCGLIFLLFTMLLSAWI